MPFWDRNGTQFWTAAQVKSTPTFGYAYPETQRWKYASSQAYTQALRQTVTQEYSGNVFQAFAEKMAVKAAVPAPAPAPASAPAVSAAVVKAEPPMAHEIRASGVGTAQNPVSENAHAG